MKPTRQFDALFTSHGFEGIGGLVRVILAAYVWVIPFTPRCRRFALDRGLTPEQQHWMHARIQDVHHHDHKTFLVGGLEIGLYGWEYLPLDPEGGMSNIDWQADVRERVLRPTSAATIHQPHIQEGGLRHMWQAPVSYCARAARGNVALPMACPPAA